MQKLSQPFIFTIFGASGDLAKLKIFPSLFSLALQNRLPKDYAIIGFARSKKSLEAFQQEFSESIKNHWKEEWTEYEQNTLDMMMLKVHYFQGAYGDTKAYEGYAKFRNNLMASYSQEIFYFSVPPFLFNTIAEHVAKMPYSKIQKIKLIIEKPFGRDEESARKLFHCIGNLFEEEQVYLLDHYLGKKAVRSIIPLRHNNRLFNLLMKGSEIANIQISALEPFGVDNRLGYFNEVGTIRDMLQSHLLQILSLITMSIPVSRSSLNIQQEKNAILSAVSFHPSSDSVSIGQYETYRDLAPEVKFSGTATFAAVKLFIDRESWYNVPIFLRSGKYVGDKKQTYIVIELKKFRFQNPADPANKFIIELSPDEKIHISFINEAGEKQIEEKSSSQSIACDGDSCLPEHSLLLLDVFRSNHFHFVSFAEILSSWHVTDQILRYVETINPSSYTNNSEGPKSQHRLTRSEGVKWHAL
jgi:glucose-6-phosphate 1-dehydrogenase